MNKKKALALIIPVIFILLSTVLIVLAFVRFKFLSNQINDDYSSCFQNEKYVEPVSVENVECITQDVSCGYAVIEMFSKWDGGDITEETLYDEYKKVVTSTGKSFSEEMNKRFPEYNTRMYKYLSNSEMIDSIYDSLHRGMPVPIEWAAKKDDEWTLHYSLVTGMDIPNNNVTVANPYGYIENISLDEFLKRTRFDAYEKMPLFLKAGFVFGMNIWMGNEEISEELTEVLEMTKSRLNKEGDYFSGWEYFANDSIGHLGGTPNYSSRIVFSEKENLGVCVLSNMNVASSTDSLCDSIFEVMKEDNMQNSKDAIFENEMPDSKDAMQQNEKKIATDVWTVFDIVFSVITLTGIIIFILALAIKNSKILIVSDYINQSIKKRSEKQ